MINLQFIKCVIESIFQKYSEKCNPGRNTPLKQHQKWASTRNQLDFVFVSGLVNTRKSMREIT